MIHAYSESYLDDAMCNLGDMLDYAVNACGYEADIFFEWFLFSGLADEFGTGNPKYIAGMSGIELAKEVVFSTSGNRPNVEAVQNEFKDAVYWAGWSLAYYQWYKAVSFKEIIRSGLTISRIQSMYILHEADISKFVEAADEIIRKNIQDKPTHLSVIRKARGFTQQELSDESGVTLRMIQLYEQRQNDINTAATNTVLRLAKALGCEMEELLEVHLD